MRGSRSLDCDDTQDSVTTELRSINRRERFGHQHERLGRELWFGNTLNFGNHAVGERIQIACSFCKITAEFGEFAGKFLKRTAHGSGRRRPL